MMKYFLLVLLVLPQVLPAQMTFKNDDCTFVSPSDFSISRDILVDGYIDILTVVENDSVETPNYLVYLHKTNIGSKINSEFLVQNPTQYTSDLKCTIISSSAASYNGYDGLQLKVKFDGYDSIVGYVFMTVFNSTLRRIIFMIPDEEYYLKYLPDIEATLHSLKLQ